MEAVTLGRYRIVREIARGAMGIVFEAEDTALRRHVALKVLKEGDADERLVRRLHREALAAAKLRHPNIIAIHDVGTAGPVHYFAMDYVDGRPLDRILADRDMPLAELVRILEDVARAVQHAHENGIVHRDLKPANILVDSSARPVVTDFGLAKDLDGAAGITRSGAAVGTPHYMAPEQVRAEAGKIGPLTDVWALGVVLYEMLAGRLPFEGESVASVFHAILTDDPRPPVKGRPAERDLEIICLRAIEKHPAFRYPSAAEFADDLRRWRGHEPVRAQAVSTMRRLGRRMRRHPAVTAALLGGLAVLAAGFPVAWHQWRERRKASALADEAGRRERARREAVPYFEAGRRQHEKAQAMARSVPRLEELLAALDEAERAFRTALDLDPLFAEAHFGLGQALALRFAEQPSDAAFLAADGHLLRAVELNASLAGARLARGSLCLERHRRSRRDPVLVFAADGGIRWDPRPAEDSPDLAVAARELERADHPATPRADLLAARGRLAHALGEYERAAARLAEAVALDPGDAESWYVLGLSRLYCGELERAEAALDEAIRWRPRYPQALAKRGLCRYARRRYAEALADLNAAIELVDEPAVLVARALCYRRMEPPRLDDAEHDLTQVLERDPGNVTALMNRGEIRRLLGRLDGAIRDWKEAVRLAPMNASGYLNLGVAHLERREWDEAIACFDRALDVRPGAANAHFNRAKAWSGKGDPERAAADMTRAIELAPNDAEAWNLRGNFREDLFAKTSDRAHQDAALADYDRAIAIDARYGLAYYNRGLLRFARKEYKEALADLRLAAQHAPELRERVEPKIREIEGILNP